MGSHHRAGLLAITGTAMSVLTAAALAHVTTGPVRADPAAGLTGWVDIPDSATVVGADAGPARATLAVLYIVPNAIDDNVRETWLLVRADGAWGPPALVSDPTRDSYQQHLDVGADGSVEVLWGEDVPGTTDDLMVVRRATGSSMGPRREIPVEPFNNPLVANGQDRTVVAWDQYDGGSWLRVKAAIDTGSGFGSPETITGTTSAWDGNTRLGDVSADAGIHVVMQRSDAGTYDAAWATRNLDGSWTRVESLPETYTATADVLPRVVADPASGNALLLHGHRVSGVPHHKATVFEADPLAVGPADQRLTPAVDLGPTGNRGSRGAILDGTTLVGVLGTALASVTAAQGVAGATLRSPAAAQCADHSWVLTEELDFVCLLRSDPAGSWVQLWSGDGALLGEVTPGSGATKVSLGVIDATVPVLLVTETTGASPAPKALLYVGTSTSDPGTSTPDPTPTPVPPTTSTTTMPTPAAPTTFSPVTPARLKGKARVGRTLRALPGTWSPTPTRTSYRWLANGKGVRNATRARLKVTPALRGKRLQVRITLTASGVASRTVTIKVAGRVR